MNEQCYKMRVRITLEVDIETDYAPSSREQWIVAMAIEKAALRTRMPKGACVVATSWPVVDAIKLLKFEAPEKLAEKR